MFKLFLEEEDKVVEKINKVEKKARNNLKKFKEIEENDC
jgi:hypothetical protein